MELHLPVGPGPLLPGPGLVLRVDVDPRRQRAIALGWASAAHTLLDALLDEAPAVEARIDEQGLWLALGLPIDLLPIGAEIAAPLLAAAESGSPCPPSTELDQRVAGLARPRLRALWETARRHGVLLRLDQAALRLGAGADSLQLPLDALPAAEDLDWLAHGRVPLALLAGSEGNCPTGEAVASMAAAAGLRCARLDDAQRPAFPALDQAIDLGLLCSSDQALLAHGSGLAPLDCVALNADDIGCRGSVFALKPGGRLVLGSALPGRDELARLAPGRCIWHSDGAPDAGLRKRIVDGEAACVVEQGRLVWYCGGARMLICAVAALEGRVSAAAAACAVAVGTSLRLPFEAIQAGLMALSRETD